MPIIINEGIIDTTLIFAIPITMFAFISFVISAWHKQKIIINYQSGSTQSTEFLSWLYVSDIMFISIMFFLMFNAFASTVLDSTILRIVTIFLFNVSVVVLSLWRWKFILKLSPISTKKTLSMVFLLPLFFNVTSPYIVVGVLLIIVVVLAFLLANAVYNYMVKRGSKD